MAGRPEMPVQEGSYSQGATPGPGPALPPHEDPLWLAWAAAVLASEEPDGPDVDEVDGMRDAARRIATLRGAPHRAAAQRNATSGEKGMVR